MDRSQDRRTLYRDRPCTIQAGEDKGKNEEQEIEEDEGVQADGDMPLSDGQGGVRGARDQGAIEGCEQEERGEGGGQTHYMGGRGDAQESIEGKQENEQRLQEGTIVPAGVNIDGRSLRPILQAASPTSSPTGATASTTTSTSSRSSKKYESHRSADRRRPSPSVSSGISSSCEPKGTVSADISTIREAIESGDPSAVWMVVGIIGKEQATTQLSALRTTNHRRQVETGIMLAARHGDVDMFHVVLRCLRQTLTEEKVAELIEARGEDGCSLLTAAAEGGNEAVFEEVVDLIGGKEITDKVWERVDAMEARCLIRMAAKSGTVAVFNRAMKIVLLRGKQAGASAIDVGRDPTETSALVEAARGGSGAMIDAVVAAMVDLLTEERVSAGLASPAGPRRLSVLMVAADSGSVEAVTAAIKAASGVHFGANPSRGMATAKDVHGNTALSYATKSGVVEIVRIVSTSMARHISAPQMLEEYNSSFATCCANLPTPVDCELLDVISYLLQCGAKPGTLDLIRLSTRTPFPRLKESLLGAVSLAKNPFIPGMNLSAAFSVASRRSSEGAKRVLLEMQASVDELLLEVLEHLPQTVRDLEGGMTSCSAVLEPETILSTRKGTIGPLGVALQRRQQMDTYCTVPLVLDFMSRKFTKGLPSLRDTEGVLENKAELSNPGQTLYGKYREAGDGLLADGRILFLGMALQRGYGESKLSNITYLPGARFIITGILSRPRSYYKVPALRMVLDLVTYLCMMAILGGFVLSGDEGVFHWAHIVFTLYIIGAIKTEVKEIVAAPWEYARDKWNVLDVTSLLLMFISLCYGYIRGIHSIEARTMYALSAPLAVSRTLFFAQILPSQGPMIQGIFSLMGELIKFGVVMIVVMGGFVLSFYSILRDSLTYGQVWTEVFKSMIGDTEFFDELSGTEFEVIATVLLAMCLVILTIMMLNLLVAVLTTAYAKVDENADQEFKVSKARLIRHYVSVVKLDRLPAPLNLIQWIVSSPMVVADLCFSTALHKDVNRCVGRVVFWAILGPIAVVAGWLLWTVSVLKAVTVVWRTSAQKALGGKVARVLIAVACCTVGAPVWLLVLWVKGGAEGVRRIVDLLRSWGGRVCCRERGRSKTVEKSKSTLLQPHDEYNTQGPEDRHEDAVVVMLKNADRGLPVGELQRYLDDPMSDPCVRRGEQTLSTTVEHVKLLRNRLEATTQEQIAELQSYFVLTAENLSRQVEDEGEATGRGNDKRKEDEAGQHDLEGIFSAKIDEFDRNLIAKTAEMEERMGTLVDARFGALERRLDMVLGKAPEQGDT